MITELREYQVRTINKLFEAIREGSKSVLVVLSCGAGKSTIFSKFCQLCVDKNKKVLFIVHRRNLVEQFAKRLYDQFGIMSGLIMSGVEQRRENILVASKQTLINRNWPDVDVIIIDEAHNAKSSDYMKIVQHYKDLGKIIVGLTATPERLDGSGLGDIFDTYINPIKMGELIDLEYLVPTKIVSVDLTIDYKKVTVTNGDYTIGKMYEAYDNKVHYEDIVKNYIEHAGGKIAVCFCVNMDHTERMCQTFNEMGIKAAYIHSGTSIEERDKIFKSFRAKEIQVLVNCNVLIEGADFDFIECGILARMTKSKMYYVQMVGRVQRKYEGKKEALILDFGQNGIEHGYVEEYDVGGFDLSSKKRSNKGGDETPKYKICENCFTLNKVSAQNCISCGVPFKFIMKPVELSTGIKMVVLDREESIFNKYRFMSHKNCKDQASGLLLMIAKIKGYKEAWAIVTMKERSEVYQQASYREIKNDLLEAEKNLGGTYSTLRLKIPDPIK